jgi:hypothetical protein
MIPSRKMSREDTVTFTKIMEVAVHSYLGSYTFPLNNVFHAAHLNLISIRVVR